MIHMEELISQFTGSGGLERQRGIDGEVAHLVQEYKDNLSSSLLLAVEKLSWEFWQLGIPEECSAPTHMDQTDSAINRHPFLPQGRMEKVQTILTLATITLCLNSWAACPSTSKSWATNQQSLPVPGKPNHLPQSTRELALPSLGRHLTHLLPPDLHSCPTQPDVHCRTSPEPFSPCRNRTHS